MKARPTCAFLLFAAVLATAAIAENDDAIAFPPPRHAVEVERSLMMPMRDGVRLSTDFYRPLGAGKRLPVILIRTQYDKASFFASDDRRDRVAQMFAGQGYVVAVQDIRGRFESEGEYQLAAHDAVDGYDAVGWIARQPWSNGRVGTYGCSSLGNTQIFAAQLRHPRLAAAIPQHSGGATRRQFWDVISGGVPEIGWALEWFRVDGNKTRVAALPKIDYAPILASLPVKAMAEKAGGPPNDWVDYIVHDPGDAWWDRFMYFKDDSKIDVPALFVNSWHDMSVGETLYLFGKFAQNGVSARARENQYVVITPTDHCHSEIPGSDFSFGGRELGDPRKNLWSLYLSWYDKWLRGNARAMDGVPKVQYYLMGKNEWRSAPAFPLPGTKFTNYYLHSDGGANGRFGDGVLTTGPGPAGRDGYVYDPATPVPTRGMNDPAYGSFDQSEVEMRQDVLVYTGPVLERGIEVTGPIEVVLHVSSSARDTDFIAKLVDVYPDGRAFEIRSGIARARFREGFDRKVWMEPGGIYEVKIDLQATGNYFAAGHRLRVDVTSSSFPRFARNLNTGGNGYDETEWVIARNTVHHGAAHPSRIVLPVIPEP